MLVLAETAIGFVVFKLTSDAKIDSKDLWKEFETPESANKTCVETPCEGLRAGSCLLNMPSHF